MTQQKIDLNFKPAAKLTTDDLNPLAINAKYAVRGKIAARAEELKEILKKDPSSVPFPEVINCNIGNPQQLDQKPLTFYRSVLSLLQSPSLLKNENISELFPADVIQRATDLISNIGSIGAYSNSQGVKYIRERVADFISKRDGEPSSPNDVFLTSGASTAVNYLLTALCVGNDTGLLIPIPQYPLYTATLALNNSNPIPYYLNEENNWSTDPIQITQAIEENLKKGIKINGLVVINPGNPTGAILEESDIRDLITIAAKYGFVLIADEVYQENIFNGKFISFKKVLRVLQRENPDGKYDNVQLASLHSTSKGVSGECGQRGGYMELVGFDPAVEAVILKLASISLCSSVSGQSLVELMCNPPTQGESSYELDHTERLSIHNGLNERAISLWKSFQNMKGVSCIKPQGAMYLFPKITIPEKAIAKAIELGEQPDEYYCSQLLENTGICAVPGSGFGQKKGTYHVRTTFLAPGTSWVKRWEDFHNKFIEDFA
ncbi:putative alanine transaminase [Ascoidea rubescens DSM 1968]|uniref:Glutamate pyruvate transaminase n=1 Tax=Ascoidea rubescens DSM 1968 TaxID=1344418 RepID=A0A1D2VP42_9ASCO|nr:putative alanine transaminase [Ascoidea rubescens DSM 1968]ODV63380.1 putative alanine transaminase [Ascoidea rubescens DSM 1968]